MLVVDTFRLGPGCIIGHTDENDVCDMSQDVRGCCKTSEGVEQRTQLTSGVTGDASSDTSERSTGDHLHRGDLGSGCSKVTFQLK